MSTTRSEAVILVCRKCSRKLEGGFGPDGDERLAKALRRRLHRQAGPLKMGRRAVTVVEVACLDLCPKGAVVVVRGDRPGDWLVVPRGTDLTMIGTALGLPFASEAIDHRPAPGTTAARASLAQTGPDEPMAAAAASSIAG